jgi:hypothetical protein
MTQEAYSIRQRAKAVVRKLPRTVEHRVCVRVVQDKDAPNYRVIIGLCRLLELYNLVAYQVVIGFHLFYNPTHRVACITCFLYTCEKSVESISTPNDRKEHHVYM